MDTNLILKPIELIDIGIDKLTKIPMPILSNNIVSSYDVDSSGAPIDSFTFTFETSSSLSGSCIIDSFYPITLTFDWGENGRYNQINVDAQPTNISYQNGFCYANYGTYTITVTGDVSLIKKFEMTDQGVMSIDPLKLKRLEELNLNHSDFSISGITTIDIDGLIYLKKIEIQNNNLVDVDSDIYITADTFLSYGNGDPSNPDCFINTNGNALPTIYSKNSRDSLEVKGWILKI